jgi:hypothetical protein
LIKVNKEAPALPFLGAILGDLAVFG